MRPELSTSDKALLQGLIMGVKRRQRTCQNPGCHNNVNSNNHILQENGLLNQISGPKRRIWQMENMPIWNPDDFTLQEETTGPTSRVLTFRGFCGTCDSRIFQPIEQASPNFADHNHLILFSYRSLVNKVQEVQETVEICQEILESRISSSVYRAGIQEKLKMFKRVQHDVLNYKRGFEEKINHPTTTNRTFEFVVVPIWNLQMALSCAFIEPTVTFEDTSVPDAPPLHLKFLHVIPNKVGSIIVFGVPYFPHVKIDSIPWGVVKSMLDSDNLPRTWATNFLTRVILRNTTTWCVSPTFYRKLACHGIDKKITNVLNGISHEIDFDMFSVL